CSVTALHTALPSHLDAAIVTRRGGNFASACRRGMIMGSSMSIAGGAAMESSAQLPLFAFMLLLIALALLWPSWGSRRVLDGWAERDGYRILDADYRNCCRGPYFWTTAKGQDDYRVAVEVEGSVRRGWVRCGSWGLGLFSGRAEVRWDE